MEAVGSSETSASFIKLYSTKFKKILVVIFTDVITSNLYIIFICVVNYTFMINSDIALKTVATQVYENILLYFYYDSYKSYFPY
jgi:hypothetical protein